MLLVVFALLILYIWGSCKLFQKMGEPVWKIFSPFHLSLVLCDKGDIDKTLRNIFLTIIFIVDILTMFFLVRYTILLFVFFLVLSFALMTFGILFVDADFRNFFNFLLDSVTNSSVLYFVLLWLAVNYLFGVYIFYKLFLKFGKTRKMALLYSLFFPVGVFIVGRDNSKYEGDYLENMIK